jgi:hypothetical protein
MLNDGLLAHVLGGWELDGLGTVSTGRPFSVSLSNTVTNGTNSWPDVTRSPVLSSPSWDHWYDPSAFLAPTTPRYGSVGRGILYGPNTVNFDLSLAKNFSILERVRVQLRADAFNIFNHPQMGFPNQTINTANPATTSTAITSTIGDNRDLQLSIKLQF